MPHISEREFKTHQNKRRRSFGFECWPEQNGVVVAGRHIGVTNVNGVPGDLQRALQPEKTLSKKCLSLSLPCTNPFSIHGSMDTDTSIMYEGSAMSPYSM